MKRLLTVNLLVLLSLICGFSMRAAEVERSSEVVFASMSFADNEVISEIVLDGIGTISLEVGDNGANAMPKYLASTGGMRIFVSNYMTFRAKEGVHFTEIKFKTVSSTDPKWDLYIESDPEGMSEGFDTWTGYAGEILFKKENVKWDYLSFEIIYVDENENDNSDISADFVHDIYIDDNGVEYNAFNALLSLNEPVAGADCYTLTLDGRLIDDNIHADAEGSVAVEIEYMPYLPEYNLAFNAMDAAGNIIETKEAAVAHRFNIPETTVEIISKWLEYNATGAHSGDIIPVDFCIRFGLAEEDAEYIFTCELDNADFEPVWDGLTLKIPAYANVEYNSSGLNLSGVVFPSLSLNVAIKAPIAYKEILSVEDASAARRKVKSADDIVTTEVKSNPVENTVQADSHLTTTGIVDAGMNTVVTPYLIDINGRIVARESAVPGVYLNNDGKRVTKIYIK